MAADAEQVLGGRVHVLDQEALVDNDDRGVEIFEHTVAARRAAAWSATVAAGGQFAIEVCCT